MIISGTPFLRGLCPGSVCLSVCCLAHALVSLPITFTPAPSFPLHSHPIQPAPPPVPSSTACRIRSLHLLVSHAHPPRSYPTPPPSASSDHLGRRYHSRLGSRRCPFISPSSDSPLSSAHPHHPSPARPCATRLLHAHCTLHIAHSAPQDWYSPASKAYLSVERSASTTFS